MSEHGKGGESHSQDSHSGDKNQGSSFGGIIAAAVIIFLFIILVKFFFFTGNNKPEVDNKPTQIEQSPGYKAPRIVRYGPEYGEISYLPSGYDYYFDGATEPYCYTNGNLVACGERNEDATGTFGNDRVNKKLRFKSQNGKHGTLKIIFIKQQTNY